MVTWRTRTIYDLRAKPIGIGKQQCKRKNRTKRNSKTGPKSRDTLYVRSVGEKLNPICAAGWRTMEEWSASIAGRKGRVAAAATRLCSARNDFCN